MSLIDDARAGIITDEMKIVARQEGGAISAKTTGTPMARSLARSCTACYTMNSRPERPDGVASPEVDEAIGLA